MKKDTRDILIVVGAAVLMVAVAFSGLFVYSGTWPPFSVVESGSMEHSEESSIGTIDTGDMVVIRTDTSNIRSYVDGWHDNYSKFGEYGDVIIYERGGGKNPVIHRPIVWLEWNGTTWDAPSLNGFTGWTATVGSSDGTGLWGTLTMTSIGFSEKTVSLNLITLPKESGYATMGDSVGNYTFDQNVGIVSGLISNEKILCVAGFEIPWIGCLKLYATDTNVDQIPPNSIPDLICTIVVGIVLLAMIFVVVDYVSWYRHRND